MNRYIKLFEEALNNRGVACIDNPNGSEVRITYHRYWEIHNLYELAYSCKAWASKKGYRLESYVTIAEPEEGHSKGIEYSGCRVWHEDTLLWSLCDPIETTEFEAVFKAAEYVRVKEIKNECNN